MNEVYTLLSNRPCPLSAVGEFFSLRTGPTTDPYHVRAHKRNMQRKKSHRGIRVHSFGSSVCVCRVVTEWSQFAWPQSIIIDGRYRHFANNLFYSQQFFFSFWFCCCGNTDVEIYEYRCNKKREFQKVVAYICMAQRCQGVCVCTEGEGWGKMVTEYFVRAFESNILACFAPNLKAISINVSTYRVWGHLTQVMGFLSSTFSALFCCIAVAHVHFM